MRSSAKCARKPRSTIEPVALAGHRDVIARDADGQFERHFVILCFAARWLGGEPSSTMNSTTRAGSSRRSLPPIAPPRGWPKLSPRRPLCWPGQLISVLRLPPSRRISSARRRWANRVKKLLTIGSIVLCLGLPAHAQSDTPAPFDNDLARLGEILGALHYLRAICGANEGAKWRNEMQALIDAEAPNGERRRKIVASFNRGYRGFQQTYEPARRPPTLPSAATSTKARKSRVKSRRATPISRSQLTFSLLRAIEPRSAC